MITRTKTIDVVVAPTELASEFWGMGSEEQATFFSELAIIAKIKIVMQLEYIRQSECLTKEGKRLMALIGEYGVEEEESRDILRELHEEDAFDMGIG